MKTLLTLCLLAGSAHAVTQPVLEQPGALLNAARASSTAATSSAMTAAAMLPAAQATATSTAQSVVLERQMLAAAQASSTAATSAALSLDSLTAATDASGTWMQASLAAAQATATSTAQSKVNLDALVADVRGTATTMQASLAALQALVANANGTATTLQASLAAVQACATLLMSGQSRGLTTGIVAPALAAVRLNAGGTIYADAVYPMGNYLAKPDSATLLVVSTGPIVVAAYVAPTHTAHFVMRNNSPTATVFIGGSTVTAATGIPIYPLEAFTMDATTGADQLWYAITASGSADLRWARW